MNYTFFLLCPVLFVIGYVFPIIPTTIDKDGLLNVYFVKFGWFWTSVVSGLCIVRYSRIANHWKRYILLSLWWLVFTQEVFGLTPLMDLVFLKSGGYCSFDVLDQSDNVHHLNLKFHDNEYRRLRGLRRMIKWLDSVDGSDSLKNALRSIIKDDKLDYNPGLIGELSGLSRLVRSSSGCSRAGGHWVGGHDPSGHIFLITLMLMLMFGELSRYQERAFRHLSRTCKRFFKRVGQFCIQLFDNGGLVNVLMQDGGSQWWYKLFVKPPLACYKTLASLAYLVVKFVLWENPILLLLTLTLMWSYSFVVTVMLFHTLLEQLSGFLAAYVVCIIVYQLV